MNVSEAALLDRHSFGQSPVHRLDPRAKVLATLVFITAVVSHPKYAISPLTPYVIYPLALAVLGFVPFKVFMRRVLIAMPVAVLIGIFNPLLDRTPLLYIFGIPISGGWVSFGGILVKALLCLSATVALFATTSFPSFIQSLHGLKVPQALVVQLMLLYRYLFLLVAEAQRLRRAEALKSASRTSLRTAAAMLSSLLLRTLDRGEAVWLAMKARGFEGELRTADQMSWRPTDTVFLAAAVVLSAGLRLVSLPELVGRWGLGL